MSARFLPDELGRLRQTRDIRLRRFGHERNTTPVRHRNTPAPVLAVAAVRSNPNMADHADIAALRVEVEAMSDRDILITLLAGQRRQNGKLADHDDDLYGNTERSILGVKPRVEEHDLALVRARASFRTVLFILGVLGVGNIAALLTLLSR